MASIGKKPQAGTRASASSLISVGGSPPYPHTPGDYISTFLTLQSPVQLDDICAHVRGAPPHTTTGTFRVVIDQIIADSEALHFAIGEVTHVGNYSSHQETWINRPTPITLEGDRLVAWIERNGDNVSREIARHIAAGTIRLTPTTFH